VFSAFACFVILPSCVKFLLAMADFFFGECTYSAFHVVFPSLASPYRVYEPDDETRLWLGACPNLFTYSVMRRAFRQQGLVHPQIMQEIMGFVGGGSRALCFEFTAPLPHPFPLVDHGIPCSNLIIMLDAYTMGLLFEQLFFGPSPLHEPTEFCLLVQRVGVAYGYEWSLRVYPASQTCVFLPRLA